MKIKFLNPVNLKTSKQPIIFIDFLTNQCKWKNQCKWVVFEQCRIYKKANRYDIPRVQCL